MQIPDSLLSYHLRNVYWISGGACGGKTTMARLLAEKYGMIIYNCDEQAMAYRKIASPEDHPAMFRHFVDWEWYFNRSGAEIARWLESVFEEQFPMTTLDLVMLNAEQPVVCEGMLPPCMVKRVSKYNRSVFLYPERELLVSQFFLRDEQRLMLELIETLTEPEKKKQNVLDCALTVEHEIRQLKDLGLKMLVRNKETTQESMLREIEEHFGLLG